MTDEQIQAACGEATKLGMRSMVHAHASGGAKAAVLAGCTTVEHGSMLDKLSLTLGTPSCSRVRHSPGSV